MILFLSVIIAMVLANSSYSEFYFDILNAPFVTGVSFFLLNMDLKTWVNDGLMTIFFLLSTLEIKKG